MSRRWDQSDFWAGSSLRTVGMFSRRNSETGLHWGQPFPWGSGGWCPRLLAVPRPSAPGQAVFKDSTGPCPDLAGGPGPREWQTPFHTSCSHRHRLLQWNFLNRIQEALENSPKQLCQQGKCWIFHQLPSAESQRQPSIQDQMFSVAARREREPCGLLTIVWRTLAATWHWRIEAAYRDRVCLWLPGSHWDQRGREWWQEGPTSHQSRWRLETLL